MWQRATGGSALTGALLQALQGMELGFSSSNQSGGQGDPYPRVVGGESGS
jgi:hypothetical protein